MDTFFMDSYFTEERIRQRTHQHSFYHQLSQAIEGERDKEMLTCLFKRLFDCYGQISDFHFESCEGYTKVSVTLNQPTTTMLKGRVVHIPQNLAFNLYPHYNHNLHPVEHACVEFDEGGKDCPITEGNTSSILKSQLTWHKVEISDENHFQLTQPHWVGLGWSFAGGTPVVSTLSMDELKNDRNSESWETV